MEKQPTVLDADPTVLEYLKRVMRGERPEAEEIVAKDVSIEDAGVPTERKQQLLLYSALAFIVGQFLIEYFRIGLSRIALVFLLLGALLLIVHNHRSHQEDTPFWGSSQKIGSENIPEEPVFRRAWLLVAVVLAVLALLIYKDGTHNLSSIGMWVGSVVCLMWAFWEKRPLSLKNSYVKSLMNGFTNDKVSLGFVLLIAITVIFIQFSQLAQVPMEMVSTQVENYLSVFGIQNGEMGLWFPRNLVSEPVGYYWAALISRLVSVPASFLGLKIAFALAGLIAVLYTYKIGKLLFDQTTGLIAALVIGVAFAPIIQQRALVGNGLILPILAAALFYHFKSLEMDDPNAQILSSLLTVIGIMTHKLFWVLPVANLVITFLYLKKLNVKYQKELLIRVGKGMVVGLVAFLPFLLVILSNFNVWFAPIASGFRLQDPTTNWFFLFLRNLVSELGVINWSNRSSWVDGIPSRAGLDWISAGFALFGLALMLITTRKENAHKRSAGIVLVILFSFFNSMNLAFPSETPTLGRSLPLIWLAGFLAARGMSVLLERIPRLFANSATFWRIGSSVLVGLILVFTNYNLLTKSYAQAYNASAWNTQDMANVLSNFDRGSQGRSIGYIVGYPHWVDARAVAILAGMPEKNLSILPADLPRTVTTNAPQIFLLNIFDKEALTALKATHPEGVISTYQSINPDKNFIIYIVGQ